jgi:regulatory protein
MKDATRRRPAKRLLPEDMRELALLYLDRFSATRRRLRDVLARRARISASLHGDDPAALLAAIEDAIAWLEKKGLLSDRSYAEARARSLAGRGQSRARIAANLIGKGVNPDTAKAAIETLNQEIGNSEIEAARKYAKKRRLGRYRSKPDLEPARFTRDLAAMARAGFSPDIAKTALEEEE